jgi:hypothetical protein
MDEAVFDRNRPRLQEIHFSFAAAELPLYSDLLGICDGSTFQAWRLEGQPIGDLAHSALQSVLQRRV